ncbi:MAG TPA: hypothetical protein VES79_13555 [Solirubrobacteraceae bacterium]|nr:hypothetical protein [Solirubrobacteraceae bacterium]
MVRLLTLSALFLLFAAPAASAGTREKILRECQEGRITGHYTPAQLRDARKNIPTDIDEYSDCRDVLGRASLSGRSGGAGGGGADGSGAGVIDAPGGVASGDGVKITAPADKHEEKAVENARRETAVAVDGERLVPGASGFTAVAARRGLPTTLLTVLVLLGLCALAAVGPAVRRRVIARRKA